jgi:hypothetical protein
MHYKSPIQSSAPRTQALDGSERGVQWIQVVCESSGAAAIGTSKIGRKTLGNCYQLECSIVSNTPNQLPSRTCWKPGDRFVVRRDADFYSFLFLYSLSCLMFRPRTRSEGNKEMVLCDMGLFYCLFLSSIDR